VAIPLELDPRQEGQSSEFGFGRTCSSADAAFETVAGGATTFTPLRATTNNPTATPTPAAIPAHRHSLRMTEDDSIKDDSRTATRDNRAAFPDCSLRGA